MWPPWQRTTQGQDQNHNQYRSKHALLLVLERKRRGSENEPVPIRVAAELQPLPRLAGRMLRRQTDRNTGARIPPVTEGIATIGPAAEVAEHVEVVAGHVAQP
jgi:hypothetical protein